MRRMPQFFFFISLFNIMKKKKEKTHISCAYSWFHVVYLSWNFSELSIYRRKSRRKYQLLFLIILIFARLILGAYSLPLIRLENNHDAVITRDNLQFYILHSWLLSIYLSNLLFNLQKFHVIEFCIVFITSLYPPMLNTFIIYKFSKFNQLAEEVPHQDIEFDSFKTIYGLRTLLLVPC